ncbi:MAG: hypothetical protein ABGX04_16845 [Myxococcales bacterium]|nr:hypothetical protein [Myxococcales bacterium]HIK84456.1 hypothetical protein [Myxococcales bacterium]
MKRNSQSWMLLFVAVASGIVKRLGFAKLFTRIALTKMLSPDRGVRVLSNYEPTEHDVFVATFGKSGTNWMMQISQQISHYGEAEFEHITGGSKIRQGDAVCCDPGCTTTTSATTKLSTT